MGSASGTHRAFFCDTNVLIRFLTNDPPAQARAVERILELAGERVVTVIVPDLVVAELAYVLTSVYGMTVLGAGDKIAELLALPGVEVADPALMADGVGIWRDTGIDFADAYLAALSRRTDDVGLLSFDRDLDQIDGVHREDPAIAGRRLAT